MPNGIVLGGGDFWRCLGHKGGALMNESSDFIKWTPKRSFAPFTMGGQSKQVPSMN